MKKTIIFVLATLLIVVVLTVLATSVPVAHADYWQGYDDYACYCDHPYNEYYFWNDNPQYEHPYYDVWTGCGIKAYYGFPNPTYHYDSADFTFESGTGGAYMPIGPLTCNWDPNSGQYIENSYNYMYGYKPYNSTYGAYGYRDDVTLSNVDISPATTTRNQAQCWFECPPAPPGFQSIGQYWCGMQYSWAGSNAVIPNGNPMQITILSSDGGTTDPGPGTYITNGDPHVTVYPDDGWTFTAWQITVDSNTWTESPWNPVDVIYDYATIQPIFEYTGGSYVSQHQRSISTTSVQPFPFAETNPGFKAQFNVDVTYAYVGQRTSGFSEPNIMNINPKITTLYAKSLYPSLICLNITDVSSATAESCNAKVEIYLIQLTSNTGMTERYLYSMGTNYSTFDNLNKVSSAINSHIDDFVDTTTINGGEGYFATNMTVGQYTFASVGSLGLYTNKPSDSGLWSLSQPNTITITVRRLGSITLSGTSVSTATASPSDSSSIQLAKFGNGFLVNKIVSSDKLLQMDPFNPLA